MKKIVVVVDGSPIRFNEEKTSAYYDEVSKYLMINDTSKEQPRKIAGFTKWDYWYYDDEKTKPEQITIFKNWFFGKLIKSYRLKEPYTLAGEWTRLEKLVNMLGQTERTTIKEIQDMSKEKHEDYDKILDPLLEQKRKINEEQEQIENKLIEFFKERIPYVLAYEYLEWFFEQTK